MTTDDDRASSAASEGRPTPNLAYRRATEYRLDPEREHLLLRALSAATPGLTRLRRYRRTWLRPDLLRRDLRGRLHGPAGHGLHGDRRCAAGGRPVDGAGGLIVVCRPGLLPGAVGRPRVDHRTDGRRGDRPTGRERPEPGGGARPPRSASIVAGWCLLARVARLGVIAELLSQPLLVGYLAGGAVLMVVGPARQRDRDRPSRATTSLLSSQSFVGVVDDTHWPTLAVGAGTLGLVLSMPLAAARAGRRPLIAVADGHRGVRAGRPARPYGVAVVGAVPTGLPTSRPARGDVGGLPDAAARRARASRWSATATPCSSPAASRSPVEDGEPADATVDPQTGVRRARRCSCRCSAC